MKSLKIIKWLLIDRWMLMLWARNLKVTGGDVDAIIKNNVASSNDIAFIGRDIRRILGVMVK